MRRRRSLATQVTVLCLAVAAVVALVAGVVAGNLVTASANKLNREALSEQADAVVRFVESDDVGKPKLGIPRIAKVLRGQEVSIVVRDPGGGYTYSGDDDIPPAAARAAGLGEVTGTKTVSKRVTVEGGQWHIEARALPDGYAFALVKPAESGEWTAQSLVRNIAFALGIGLAVAALAGLLLSRVLSRPLRQAASVATAMRAGRRDLRAPERGAAEVAEVAASVNSLSDALRYSESRQRRFLLSVSHELRTPLTAIKGFAESLADGVVTTEPEAARVGATMLAEADRLDRLVSDLLDLARLGAVEFHLDMEEVDLKSLVRDTAEVWKTRCRHEGLDFRVNTPQCPVMAYADPKRLRQVLDILLDNAARVTPAGAPVVLALSAEPAGVQVRDGGPGLSAQDRHIAFEPGALRDRYAGQRKVGSGVGLALAHGLVERMGGELTVSPAAEGGAAFFTRLESSSDTA